MEGDCREMDVNSWFNIYGPTFDYVIFIEWFSFFYEWSWFKIESNFWEEEICLKNDHFGVVLMFEEEIFYLGWRILIYYKFESIRLAALKLQKFYDFLVLSIEFIFEVIAAIAVSSVTDGYS